MTWTQAVMERDAMLDAQGGRPWETRPDSRWAEVWFNERWADVVIFLDREELGGRVENAIALENVGAS